MEIRQYVRDKNRNPIGVLVCVNGFMGWSKVNLKKGDRYNKSLGLEIAHGRAATGRMCYRTPFCIDRLPKEVRRDWHNFSVRCAKVFQSEISNPEK